MDAARALRQITSLRVPPDRMSAAQTSAVLDAARATEAADGLPPLNDDQLIALEHPDGVPVDTEVVHLSVPAPDADQLVGYAQLDVRSEVASGTLFVVPDSRGRGLGGALLESALQSSGGEISLWAPGDHPGARRLAETHAMTAVRTLLIMSRTLDDTLPAAAVPGGLELRSFDPVGDEAGFLQVNARAFAAHPEQGRLDHRGFAAKAAEPWFDPRGFFLAVDHDQRDPDLPGHTTDGRILGFHWTKQRGPDPADPDPDGRRGRGLGEVYVIGVDPDAEGRGLAKALLSRGLDHLREGGSGRVILYVEGDHQRAVGLYERYGFEVSRRDVMYARHLDAETPRT